MHSRLSTQSIYYSKGKSKEGNKTKQSREKEKQKKEKQGRKRLQEQGKGKEQKKQAHTRRQKGVTPFLRKNEIPNFEYRNTRIGAI